MFMTIRMIVRDKKQSDTSLEDGIFSLLFNFDQLLDRRFFKLYWLSWSGAETCANALVLKWSHLWTQQSLRQECKQEKISLTRDDLLLVLTQKTEHPLSLEVNWSLIELELRTETKSEHERDFDQYNRRQIRGRFSLIHLLQNHFVPSVNYKLLFLQ